jgi:hypothetical protein
LQNIVTGNAAADSAAFRGWLIGDFVPRELGLRWTPAVEVKWGIHAIGESRSDWGVAAAATSLSVLVRGAIRLAFSNGQEALLEHPGDYAVWGAGVAHHWRIEQDDTVVVTVRWPASSESESA